MWTGFLCCFDFGVLGDVDAIGDPGGVASAGFDILMYEEFQLSHGLSHKTSRLLKTRFYIGPQDLKVWTSPEAYWLCGFNGQPQTRWDLLIKISPDLPAGSQWNGRPDRNRIKVAEV